jgi:arginine decarboxylase
MLSDTYFCNFSLFQSMPDSWAVKQLFPIMPIHRLNEMPTRSGVLGDISCDSDGKIDQFIDRRDVKKTLPLHPSMASRTSGRVPGGRLSGDPGRSAQPVRRYQRRARQPGRNGDVILDAVIRGDTVREVLDYVQFNSKVLLEEFRRDVETALREGDRLRRIRAAAQILRRGPQRLHVPRAVVFTTTCG